MRSTAPGASDYTCARRQGVRQLLRGCTSDAMALRSRLHPPLARGAAALPAVRRQRRRSLGLAAAALPSRGSRSAARLGRLGLLGSRDAPAMLALASWRGMSRVAALPAREAGAALPARCSRSPCPRDRRCRARSCPAMLATLGGVARTRATGRRAAGAVLAARWRCSPAPRREPVAGALACTSIAVYRVVLPAQRRAADAPTTIPQWNAPRQSWPAATCTPMLSGDRGLPNPGIGE